MDIKVDAHTVIVFDLDDTLYNELDYLKSSYKSIALFLEPINWKLLYSNMFSMYRSKLNVFEYLTNSYEIDIETLIEMYRNHQPSLELFNGVTELFEAIKSKNGRIGIITDGRARTQRAKMESLGITNYIDKIVISEEIGFEKPSQENFKAIENSLNGNVYYYVADNCKKDFIAPNALGWKSVALIDNGKNIHFESHKFQSIQNAPQNLIIELTELKII
ncbi:MAG: HAD family hydrolase [Aquaticitalea sp.]